MCGIAGILELSGSAVDAAPLDGMVGAIRHRGPDARGMWSDGPIALGHARLSIIDLHTGAQPMCNPARNLWITYNGEIFNYRELREELIARGHRFATTCDTEVILHLYEEKGEDCVEDLNGQWAFALWDARRGRLFLSRDRLGIRPLYTAQTQGRLLFGSEVKALYRHPALERGLDWAALDDVFTFWGPLASRSVFKGVEELPPGHSMSVEGGQVKVWRHWGLSYGEGPKLASDADYIDGLRELLVDSTRLRLRADVPVGAYLSGGLDSSVTVAMIRNFTDTPLETFSVAFDDPEFDESAYQREVTRHLGTDHHEVRCSHADIGRMFPDIVWHAEAPLMRTAPAPLFMLSSLVHSHGFKVVITGEGADEMLGGYDIFKEAKIRRFWAAFPDSELRPLLLKRLYPYMKNLQNQPQAYRKAFFHIRPEDLESVFFSHLPRWNLSSGIKRLYSADAKAELAGRDPTADLLTSLPDDYAHWHPFEQAQFLEATILMPGYILSSQGDRMAMGNSVEGRFPFLDHRVVEFANSIPPRLKMKVLDEKHVLKRAAEDWIPPAVAKRPKQPYRAPDAVSLLGDESGKGRPEWLGDLLSPQRLRSSGVFNPVAVEKLMRKFEKGRAIGVRDNMAVVGVVSTELLIEQFINQQRG